jgi:tetratricopeptide (TPR) repeat protein
MWDLGRIEEGLERMNQSYELLAREEPDADLATLAAQLGRFLFFAGQRDAAMERIEAALTMAESLVIPEVIANALTSRGIILWSESRRREALALAREALEISREHDKPSAALRASYNLADMLSQGDRYTEAADVVRDGLAHARRVGNGYWELSLLGQLYPFLALGEWDEALQMFAALPAEEWQQQRVAFGATPLVLATVGVHRGETDELIRTLEDFAPMETSADEQERSAYKCALARVAFARGDHERALRDAEEAFASRANFGYAAEQVKEAFVTAAEAALALGDDARVEQLVALVDALPPGSSTHFLQAQVSRFRAHLARSDQQEAHRLFRLAAGLLRELSMPFHLAVVHVEHGELLATGGSFDEAQPLLDEARETFERLRATPWIERIDAARVAAEVEV